MRSNEIIYEVWCEDLFLRSFIGRYKKEEAIKYAKSNKGREVIKINDFTGETLGVVWEINSNK